VESDAYRQTVVLTAEKHNGRWGIRVDCSGICGELGLGAEIRALGAEHGRRRHVDAELEAVLERLVEAAGELVDRAGAELGARAAAWRHGSCAVQTGTDKQQRMEKQ
jgi:hypothetical protein